MHHLTMVFKEMYVQRNVSLGNFLVCKHHIVSVCKLICHRSNLLMLT